MYQVLLNVLLLARLQIILIFNNCILFKKINILLIYVYFCFYISYAGYYN